MQELRIGNNNEKTNCFRMKIVSEMERLLYPCKSAESSSIPNRGLSNKKKNSEKEFQNKWREKK